MLRFLLNQTLVEESNLPPDLTVLEYLRQNQQLTGTKEGCGSGDCGACTVVIAGVVDNQLVYKSVNSCLALAGDLHGKQLITVEHLADRGSLHCTQQAMVDCHGSQCGFCTPGFVMSLFALTKNPEPQGESRRQQIERHLGGNLCRCTGYRPIIDAADRALDHTSTAGDDQFDRQAAATVSQLQSITFESNAGAFCRPQSVKELLAFKAQHPHAPVVSGATDFSLEITQRLKSYPAIIATSGVAELNTICLNDGVWQIGAACSIERLLHTLGPHHEGLRELLVRYGSTQIRNQATVGGNIGNASPIGDLPPLLIALGAELTLKSMSSERVIALQDFFIAYKKTALKPDEIITAVTFKQERLVGSGCFKVYKVSKRIDDDISTVCAAFHWQPTGDDNGVLTAAYGGMAAIPMRALALESMAQNITSTQFELARAMDTLDNDFTPIDDARASARYRQTIAKNLFKRFVLELNNGTTGQAIKLGDVIHG